MPKIAYKCNYCDSEQDVLKHEKTCKYNPEKRLCDSCEFYQESDGSGAFGCWNECTLAGAKYYGLEADRKDFSPCDFWVKEK